MKTLEQVSLELDELRTRVIADSHEMEDLRQLSEEQLTAAKSLLVESKLAQEYARHAFRIDDCGWIWRWDLDLHKYVRTKTRICHGKGGCSSGLADGSVLIRHLSDEVLELINSGGHGGEPIPRLDISLSLGEIMAIGEHNLMRCRVKYGHEDWTNLVDYWSIERFSGDNEHARLEDREWNARSKAQHFNGTMMLEYSVDPEINDICETPTVFNIIARHSGLVMARGQLTV